jgi:hypothetical protein
MPRTTRCLVCAALLAGTAARALEGELLTYARYFGSDGESVPAIKTIGTLPADAGAREVYRLLHGTNDLDRHLKPLLSPEAKRTYARRYLQLVVNVTERGGREERSQLRGYYRAAMESVDEQDTGAKTFYLLRTLALLEEEDAEAATPVFTRLVELTAGDALPLRLAYLAGLERYLAIGSFERSERQRLEDAFNTGLVAAAVTLADIGGFDAARAALAGARKGFPRSWTDTYEFLMAFVDRREALRKDAARLLAAGNRTQESARDWAMLLLATFRRPEEAYEAMNASGNSTLEGLETLLRTTGGLKAAAQVVSDLAEQFEEPRATGLRLLALELCRRAAPKRDLPQAARLRSEINGRVDPRLALILDPEAACRGPTIRLFSDPPRSYVYIDNALQAEPGALLRTPCDAAGVTPERHRIVLADLGRRDVTFSSVTPVHGLCLSGEHRPGPSAILARAGKNVFLKRRIRVDGVVEGPDALFDGVTEAEGTRSGFAASPWPCTFTLLLPRALALSALRIKLWDGDDRSYRYTLDLSPDGRTVYRAADRSQAGGSSWQNLLFPTQKVRVIQLHGLHNPKNSKFHVLELEGYEIASPEHMTDPIVWRGP